MLVNHRVSLVEYSVEPTFFLRSALLLVLLISCGCSSEPVPDGQIMVKNDSMDSEYNVIKVSGGGKSVSLNPKEYVILPKGTRTIRMSRRYKDYTRDYTVECPAKLDAGIRIKMIDVHVNRIAGGCTTVAAETY